MKTTNPRKSMRQIDAVENFPGKKIVLIRADIGCQTTHKNQLNNGLTKGKEYFGLKPG